MTTSDDNDFKTARNLQIKGVLFDTNLGWGNGPNYLVSRFGFPLFSNALKWWNMTVIGDIRRR